MKNKTHPKTKKEAKELGVKHYFTGNECLRGHLELRLVSTGACLGCARFHNAEAMKDPEKRKRSRDKSREINKERYKNDNEYREKVIRDSVDRNEKFYKTEEGKKRKREYSRNYRERNKDRYRHLSKMKARKQRATDKGKAIQFMRDCLRRCLIKGRSKNARCFEILGYNPEDLISNIESKFKDGMSWDNHGEWHIDHIKPISKFDIGANPSVVNSLDNLQPLWASDNLKKGAK